MLASARLRLALLVALGLAGALSPALFSAGCGPSGVGVEACRKIEDARCEAAASCGLSQQQVDNCKLVYQDQCLHGIQNSAYHPTQSDTDGCVAAVKAAGACAAAGVKSMAACPDAPLVSGAVDTDPCTIITAKADELSACAFATGVPDAGTTTSSTTTTSSATTSSSSSSTSDGG